MRYFPFYMLTEQKEFLVIGGGMLAYQKVKVISSYDTHIHIVTKKLCNELSELASGQSEKIQVSERMFKDKDLDSADYVVVATKDGGLNHWISKLCKERHIPVNVAEDEAESSFIMPAVISGGEFDVSISTGGKSPEAAAYLKKKMMDQIPDRFGELVAALGVCRSSIKERIPSADIRKEALECLLSIGIMNDCTLTKEVIEDVVRHLVNEMK